jgi:hypothetical protein
MTSGRYTKEMFEQERKERAEKVEREAQERRERMAKDGAKQAWVADGGSEAAFEKVWPEIRDELHRRRVLDADEQARLAQRGTGVSRI